MISQWMATQENETFPKSIVFAGERKQQLRYGENPHQAAAFYVAKEPGRPRAGIATATQLQGKELSYNNLNDTDVAYELAAEFDAARLRHHQACLYLVRGGGRRSSHGLQARPGLRSRQRFRRHHRGQSRTRPRYRRSHRQAVRRGDHCTVGHGRCPRGPGAKGEIRAFGKMPAPCPIPPPRETSCAPSPAAGCCKPVIAGGLLSPI